MKWRREIREDFWLLACTAREKIMAFAELRDAPKRTSILLIYFYTSEKIMS